MSNLNVKTGPIFLSIEIKIGSVDMKIGIKLVRLFFSHLVWGERKQRCRDSFININNNKKKCFPFLENSIEPQKSPWKRYNFVAQSSTTTVLVVVDVKVVFAEKKSDENCIENKIAHFIWSSLTMALSSDSQPLVRENLQNGSPK